MQVQTEKVKMCSLSKGTRFKQFDTDNYNYVIVGNYKTFVTYRIEGDESPVKKQMKSFPPIMVIVLDNQKSKLKVRIISFPSYREVVKAHADACEIHGECTITRDMQAAIAFMCNFNQMSFAAMAAGDVNNGKKDQPFDIRFLDKTARQVITNRVYMS